MKVGCLLEKLASDSELGWRFSLLGPQRALPAAAMWMNRFRCILVQSGMVLYLQEPLGLLY